MSTELYETFYIITLLLLILFFGAMGRPADNVPQAAKEVHRAAQSRRIRRLITRTQQKILHCQNKDKPHNAEYLAALLDRMIIERRDCTELAIQSALAEYRTPEQLAHTMAMLNCKRATFLAIPREIRRAL